VCVCVSVSCLCLCLCLCLSVCLCVSLSWDGLYVSVCVSVCVCVYLRTISREVCGIFSDMSWFLMLFTWDRCIFDSTVICTVWITALSLVEEFFRSCTSVARISTHCVISTPNHHTRSLFHQGYTIHHAFRNRCSPPLWGRFDSQP